MTGRNKFSFATSMPFTLYRLLGMLLFGKKFAAMYPAVSLQMSTVAWLACAAVDIRSQPTCQREHLTITAATSISKDRGGREPISFYVNIIFMMLEDLDLFYSAVCNKFTGAPKQLF